MGLRGKVFGRLGPACNSLRSTQFEAPPSTGPVVEIAVLQKEDQSSDEIPTPIDLFRVTSHGNAIRRRRRHDARAGAGNKGGHLARHLRHGRPPPRYLFSLPFSVCFPSLFLGHQMQMGSGWCSSPNLTMVSPLRAGADTEGFYTTMQEKILERYGKVFDWSVKAKMMGKTTAESTRILFEEFDLSRLLTPEQFLEEREIMLQMLLPTCVAMPGEQDVSASATTTSLFWHDCMTEYTVIVICLACTIVRERTSWITVVGRIFLFEFIVCKCHTLVLS